MVFLLKKAAVAALIAAGLTFGTISFFAQESMNRIRAKGGRIYNASGSGRSRNQNLYGNRIQMTSTSSPLLDSTINAPCNCQVITDCLNLNDGKVIRGRYCGFQGFQRKVCCDDNGSQKPLSPAQLEQARVLADLSKSYRNPDLFRNEDLYSISSPGESQSQNDDDNDDYYNVKEGSGGGGSSTTRKPDSLISPLDVLSFGELDKDKTTTSTQSTTSGVSGPDKNSRKLDTIADLFPDYYESSESENMEKAQEKGLIKGLNNSDIDEPSGNINNSKITIESIFTRFFPNYYEELVKEIKELKDSEGESTTIASSSSLSELDISNNSSANNSSDVGEGINNMNKDELKSTTVKSDEFETVTSILSSKTTMEEVATMISKSKTVRIGFGDIGTNATLMVNGSEEEKESIKQKAVSDLETSSSSTEGIGRNIEADFTTTTEASDSRINDSSLAEVKAFDTDEATTVSVSDTEVLTNTTSGTMLGSSTTESSITTLKSLQATNKATLDEEITSASSEFIPDSEIADSVTTTIIPMTKELNNNQESSFTPISEESSTTTNTPISEITTNKILESPEEESEKDDKVITTTTTELVPTIASPTKEPLMVEMKLREDVTQMNFITESIDNSTLTSIPKEVMSVGRGDNGPNILKEIIMESSTTTEKASATTIQSIPIQMTLYSLEETDTTQTPNKDVPIDISKASSTKILTQGITESVSVASTESEDQQQTTTIMPPIQSNNTIDVINLEKPSSNFQTSNLLFKNDSTLKEIPLNFETTLSPSGSGDLRLNLDLESKDTTTLSSTTDKMKVISSSDSESPTTNQSSSLSLDITTKESSTLNQNDVPGGKDNYQETTTTENKLIPQDLTITKEEAKETESTTISSMIEEGISTIKSILESLMDTYSKQNETELDDLSKAFETTTLGIVSSTANLKDFTDTSTSTSAFTTIKPDLLEMVNEEMRAQDDPESEDTSTIIPDLFTTSSFVPTMQPKDFPTTEASNDYDKSDRVTDRVIESEYTSSFSPSNKKEESLEEISIPTQIPILSSTTLKFESKNESDEIVNISTSSESDRELSEVATVSRPEVETESLYKELSSTTIASSEITSNLDINDETNMKSTESSVGSTTTVKDSTPSLALGDTMMTTMISSDNDQFTTISSKSILISSDNKTDNLISSTEVYLPSTLMSTEKAKKSLLDEKIETTMNPGVVISSTITSDSDTVMRDLMTTTLQGPSQIFDEFTTTFKSVNEVNPIEMSPADTEESNEAIASTTLKSSILLTTLKSQNEGVQDEDTTVEMLQDLTTSSSIFPTIPNDQSNDSFTTTITPSKTDSGMISEENINSIRKSDTESNTESSLETSTFKISVTIPTSTMLNKVSDSFNDIDTTNEMIIERLSTTSRSTDDSDLETTESGVTGKPLENMSDEEIRTAKKLQSGENLLKEIKSNKFKSLTSSGTTGSPQEFEPLTSTSSYEPFLETNVPTQSGIKSQNISLSKKEDSTTILPIEMSSLKGINIISTTLSGSSDEIIEMNEIPTTSSSAYENMNPSSINEDLSKDDDMTSTWSSNFEDKTTSTTTTLPFALDEDISMTTFTSLRSKSLIELTTFPSMKDTSSTELPTSDDILTSSKITSTNDMLEMTLPDERDTTTKSSLTEDDNFERDTTTTNPISSKESIKAVINKTESKSERIKNLGSTEPSVHDFTTKILNESEIRTTVLPILKDDIEQSTQTNDQIKTNTSLSVIESTTIFSRITSEESTTLSYKSKASESESSTTIDPNDIVQSTTIIYENENENVTNPTRILDVDYLIDSIKAEGEGMKFDDNFNITENSTDAMSKAVEMNLESATTPKSDPTIEKAFNKEVGTTTILTSLKIVNESTEKAVGDSTTTMKSSFETTTEQPEVTTSKQDFTFEDGLIEERETTTEILPSAPNNNQQFVLNIIEILPPKNTEVINMTKVSYSGEEFGENEIFSEEDQEGKNLLSFNSTEMIKDILTNMNESTTNSTIVSTSKDNISETTTKSEEVSLRITTTEIPELLLPNTELPIPSIESTKSPSTMETSTLFNFKSDSESTDSITTAQDLTSVDSIIPEITTTKGMDLYESLQVEEFNSTSISMSTTTDSLDNSSYTTTQNSVTESQDEATDFTMPIIRSESNVKLLEDEINKIRNITSQADNSTTSNPLIINDEDIFSTTMESTQSDLTEAPVQLNKTTSNSSILDLDDMIETTTNLNKFKSESSMSLDDIPTTTISPETLIMETTKQPLKTFMRNANTSIESKDQTLAPIEDSSTESITVTPTIPSLTESINFEDFDEIENDTAKQPFEDSTVKTNSNLIKDIFSEYTDNETSTSDETMSTSTEIPIIENTTPLTINSLEIVTQLPSEKDSEYSSTLVSTFPQESVTSISLMITNITSILNQNQNSLVSNAMSPIDLRTSTETTHSIRKIPERDRTVEELLKALSKVKTKVTQSIHSEQNLPTREMEPEVQTSTIKEGEIETTTATGTTVEGEIETTTATGTTVEGEIETTTNNFYQSTSKILSQDSSEATTKFYKGEGEISTLIPVLLSKSNESTSIKNETDTELQFDDTSDLRESEHVSEQFESSDETTTNSVDTPKNANSNSDQIIEQITISSLEFDQSTLKNLEGLNITSNAEEAIILSTTNFVPELEPTMEEQEQTYSTTTGTIINNDTTTTLISSIGDLNNKVMNIQSSRNQRLLDNSNIKINALKEPKFLESTPMSILNTTTTSTKTGETNITPKPERVKEITTDPNLSKLYDEPTSQIDSPASQDDDSPSSLEESQNQEETTSISQDFEKMSYTIATNPEQFKILNKTIPNPLPNLNESEATQKNFDIDQTTSFKFPNHEKDNFSTSESKSPHTYTQNLINLYNEIFNSVGSAPMENSTEKYPHNHHHHHYFPNSQSSQNSQRKNNRKHILEVVTQPPTESSLGLSLDELSSSKTDTEQIDQTEFPQLGLTSTTQSSPKLTVNVKIGPGPGPTPKARALFPEEAFEIEKQLNNQISNVVNQLLLTTHKNFRLLPSFLECAAASSRRGRRKTRVLNFDTDNYPWMARIGFQEPGGITFSCSGTIISQRYILTSAFCAQRHSGRITEVLLESAKHLTSQTNESLIEASKYKYKVERVIPHSEFDVKSRVNDLALIRLAEELQFNSSSEIRPICLPFEDGYGVWGSLPTSGDTAYIGGWGFEQKNTTKKQVDLSEASVRLWSNENCSRAYELNGGDKRVTSQQLCAYNSEDEICRGDAGAPLMAVMTRHKIFFQIGILSYGPQCGYQVPRVFTRVSEYLTWILDSMDP